jgi:hypothetical protein
MLMAIVIPARFREGLLGTGPRGFLLGWCTDRQEAPCGSRGMTLYFSHKAIEICQETIILVIAGSPTPCKIANDAADCSI